MIKFFADSTMDISPEDVKKYDITLVPITVILGDTPYKDGYELNPEKIYDYVKETGNLPKTSACNAETYKEYWQPALDRGDEIIHFSFSGDMSTSCAAATTAAGELDGVSVIDTKNLSTGSGLLLRRKSCARCRREFPPFRQALLSTNSIISIREAAARESRSLPQPRST